MVASQVQSQDQPNKSDNQAQLQVQILNMCIPRSLMSGVWSYGHGIGLVTLLLLKNSDLNK